jgi:hypothetical protein
MDVTIGKTLAMLGFVRRLSGEFRDPHILRTLYVRPKLEYHTFYDVHVNRNERVQRKFVRYALRGLGWTDMYDLPLYVYRCALIHLETLTIRRSDAFVMFVFDVW